MALRFPLAVDADLSPETREIVAKMPPLNIVRLLANAPASLPPLLELAFSILFRSELEPRKREIAVLRVAHATRSRYEWVQHVNFAKSVGVTDAEIAKIDADGPVTTLDEEGNLLCRVADEISRDVRLSEEALAAILSRYGRRQAMELIVCCSHFNMISRIIESARIELEPEGKRLRPSDMEAAAKGR